MPSAVVVEEPKLERMSERTMPLSVSTFTPLLPSLGNGPLVSSGISAGRRGAAGTGAAPARRRSAGAPPPGPPRDRRSGRRTTPAVAVRWSWSTPPSCSTRGRRGGLGVRAARGESEQAGGAGGQGQHPSPVRRWWAGRSRGPDRGLPARRVAGRSRWFMCTMMRDRTQRPLGDSLGSAWESPSAEGTDLGADAGRAVGCMPTRRCARAAAGRPCR